MFSSLIKNQQVKLIFAACARYGGDVRFVGGCVRDSLISKQIVDIDLATNLTPQEIIEALKHYNITAIPTGIKHGTVTVVIDNQQFEITTLRMDVACDGRHAKIEYTKDWKIDAARRDFTINAMSANLDGKLFDYFAGLQDLENGIIRFVGNAEQRINEDYLRILRYFRFVAYYGKGSYNYEAIKACKKLAAGVVNLSGERIQTEMLKIISAPNFVKILEKMQSIGLLEYLLPNITIDFSLLQKLQQREQIYGSNIMRRFAAILLPDINKLPAIITKWRLPNSYKTYFSKFVLDIVDPKQAIRAMGSNIFIDKILLGTTRDDEDISILVELAKDWIPPTFPLAGKDLLELGIKPTKQMGDLLKQAENFWQQHDYQLNKEQLLNFIKQINW